MSDYEKRELNKILTMSLPMDIGYDPVSKEFTQYSQDRYYLLVAREALKNSVPLEKYVWLLKHSWEYGAISKAKASELLECSLIDFDQALAELKSKYGSVK